ncbi:MAG: hypothetical protein RL757_2582 [Bacteroidota bacterium]|jgi:DNA-binding MarR family transcriptional regulator
MKERLSLKTEDAIISDVKDAYLKVMVNIELTYGWQSAVIDQRFKDFQLSRQQYNVLRIVRGQHGALLSVNDIKLRMLDKMSNVTRLIDKLEERKLLTRTEGEDDRRVRWVSITPKGRELMDKLDKVIPEITDQFSALSHDEASQLTHLLEKYRAGKS